MFYNISDLDIILLACTLFILGNDYSIPRPKSHAFNFTSVTDILRIENLWQFTSLKKLQLDNNIIEDITGLTTLVHLEWLDLSFNNIAVITGLDKLVNLKDLSLAHNRVSMVENMESLVNLHVFSLANNLLEDMENVCSNTDSIPLTSD